MSPCSILQYTFAVTCLQDLAVSTKNQAGVQPAPCLAPLPDARQSAKVYFRPSLHFSLCTKRNFKNMQDGAVVEGEFGHGHSWV